MNGGGAPSGDGYVDGVEVRVHDDVNTILVVTWTQVTAVDQVFLEFTFEEGNVMTSRPKPGTTGPHQDVVLGVPGATLVNIRIVSRQGTTDYKTMQYQGTTEAVPSGMPDPTVSDYDPEKASKDRWLFGSVEDSRGGNAQNYFDRTFWLYIMDRKGRIVWYYADPSTLATSSFQRRALDGEYIWIEKRCFGCNGFDESVLKLTLDHSYEEEVPVPGLADCIDVTSDGALLYDANDELREMNRDGDVRTVFKCHDHFGQGFNCYTNTINWVASDDSVIMSYPEPATIIQVKRDTGAVVGQYGEADDSYGFGPPLVMPPTAWEFSINHFPNLNQAGNLMVSTHMPGYHEFESPPTPHQHAFVEFSIDRTNKVLNEVWRYTEGVEWAHSKGMAIRLANGNTLMNYGTGGVIREVTPDKKTVFNVKFDVTTGDDNYNKMVGNNELVDDLYALNGGGPK